MAPCSESQVSSSRQAGPAHHAADISCRSERLCSLLNLESCRFALLVQLVGEQLQSRGSQNRRHDRPLFNGGGILPQEGAAEHSVLQVFRGPRTAEQGD